MQKSLPSLPALSTLTLPVQRVDGVSRVGVEDFLAVEEPLEIRVDACVDGVRIQKSISITMRTPGHDFELAIGFLFTEGMIHSAMAVEEISHCGPPQLLKGIRNVVKVRLADSVRIDLGKLQRHFYTSSSCGVCGKSSIDALKTQSLYDPFREQPALSVTAKVICSLPDTLRAAQEIFDSTGGLHASALFDGEGRLVLLAEDVGRHNALDKVIGAALQKELLPLADLVLLVSGRVSFELVQKASMAGVRVIAAVGAPSSLAVELAKEMNMTLLGFVRGSRFNIYTGGERVH